MHHVFRAVCRRWVDRFGRHPLAERAGGAGAGDPLRPTVILTPKNYWRPSSAVLRVSLDGSILGEVVAPYLTPRSAAGSGFYVAPAMGVDFVEPWVVVRDD